jgi:hypothetical protein
MLLLLACTASTLDSARPLDSESSSVDTHDSVDTYDSEGTHDSVDPHDSAGTHSGDTHSVDTGPTLWRSELYPEDWTPAYTTDDGHYLHDFSYAGYHAGEVAIPTASGTVYDVTTYGADPTGDADSTDAIQRAIDAAVAPAIVDFPAGTYRIDGTLDVSTSGVVLRGAGVGATFLAFTKFDGLDYAAHLTFAGAVTQGADHLLTADASARETTIELDTAGLSVGDAVVIGFTITPEFVEEHGMTGTWVTFNDDWKAFFRRTIVALDATSVTLDVPIRYPMKLRDGASLRVETGHLTEVGLEGMSMSNAANWADAWSTTQVHLVLMSGVRDAWVRDIASFASPYPDDGEGQHLISSGIEILDSRRVTISDVTLENAAHRGDGGNGYLFEISRSNEILTVDATARAGRHNFIQNWDFGTSGCVWLRTTSEDGRSLLGDWDPIGYASYSEFHHSLAMANLIDQSTTTDGWQGVNRQGESSGAGHSATQNVWWNLTGEGYLRSLQYGDGYIVGTEGMEVHVDPTEWDWNDSGEGTSPEDWAEGLGAARTLDPPSLYEDQLGRRLGG